MVVRCRKGVVMEKILELVKEMRKAQKEYFASRSYEALRKSKALETQVDKELADMEQNQLELF